MDDVMLPCTRCSKELPADDFYAAKHSWCKKCTIDQNRVRRQALEGEAKERDDERNRRYSRRKRLRKYGMTEADYDEMFARQGGVCAICGGPERTKQPHRKSGTDGLSVDHDHETGEVRGLLCFMCNTAIGKFRDDPDMLRAAIRYLERAS